MSGIRRTQRTARVPIVLICSSQSVRVGDYGIWREVYECWEIGYRFLVDLRLVPVKFLSSLKIESWDLNLYSLGSIRFHLGYNERFYWELCVQVIGGSGKN